MGSLHARRPPKLEQGDLRRKNRNAAAHPPLKGGGALRRLPTGGPGNDQGNSGKSQFCSPSRMIKSIIVMVFLTFVYMRLRDKFGQSKMKGISPGLRANASDTEIG